MSSTELQHSLDGKHNMYRGSNHRMSCGFCLEDNQERDQKRLDELVRETERLKVEKTDLLRQNVTCKTDIKKLKNRYSFFIREENKNSGSRHSLKNWIGQTKKYCVLEGCSNAPPTEAPQRMSIASCALIGQQLAMKIMLL